MHLSPGWEQQARRYASQVKGDFFGLVAKREVERSVFQHRADFRMSRCQHRCICFIREAGGDVLILAIQHEQMDLLPSFRERLRRRP